ncbi:MAG: alpha-L-fucosidase [bacterium]
MIREREKSMMTISLCLGKHRLLQGAILLALICTAGTGQEKTEWLKHAQWGIMTHYLADWRARVDNEAMSVDTWNEMIDHFDVKGLAEQIASVGAGYYLITIGQNSGYYLAPNATYDRFVGSTPSKCSRRDLVADLFEELNDKGIKLMVYLPSGAPAGDSISRARLQWQNGPNRNRDFQIKWERVIREWSERWGQKISGWWFDGCYWPNTMYRSTEPPNFASFAAAARAGNPQSLIAFNPGVVYRSLSITPFEDYIAGEIDQPDRISIKRANNGKIDEAQIHVLSFLGERWGMGSPRFTTEQVLDWSKKVLTEGGVITWDVPLQRNGLISQPFIEQLTALGKALKRD